TRVWTLVILAAVCAIISWLLLRQVYSVLPALPWTGVPALLLLAVGEAWSGRSLRGRLRGRGKPVHPIAVARMAALAKATSLAAACVGGLAAAVDEVIPVDPERVFRPRVRVALGHLEDLGQARAERPGRQCGQPARACVRQIQRRSDLAQQALEPGQAVALGPGYDAQYAR